MPANTPEHHRSDGVLSRLFTRLYPRALSCKDGYLEQIAVQQYSTACVQLFHSKWLHFIAQLTFYLQQTKDLGSSNGFDLGDTVGISQDDTDLRRGETTLSKSVNLVLNLISRKVYPSGSGSLVRKSGFAHSLSENIDMIY